jgi:hypothetical protein
MKLVILGAGASFDSIYDFFDDIDVMPWRPPLANEMFDTRLEFRNIIQTYPGSRYFFSQANGINDIEDFFQKQWVFLKSNRAEHLASSLINLNYWLAHLMYQISNNYSNVGLSNYDVLVQKAYEYAIKKKEDVIFVSFNYDTLLEQSMRKIFLSNSDKLQIADYIKFPLKIIKPHGSCNWVRRFNLEYKITQNTSIQDHLFNNKISLREINKNLENEIRCTETIGGIVYDEPNSPRICLPQLLIPLKDKDDFILPKEHFDYLRDNIHKVNDILIIGWKGTEAKFQQLLKTSLSSKKINVTSVNANYKDIENVLRPYIINAVFNHYGEPTILVKSDNRKVKGVIENTRAISHNSGTFSSYIINILQEKTVNFFTM